jgi:hypothetical protein
VKAAGALLLLAVGLLQIAADALGLPSLKGLAAAWGASPAPKVFCSARGLETFSTRFFLEWKGKGGGAHVLALTPEVYGRVRGPYNRRNVYGAALAYGPVLATDPRTRAMFEAVIRHALCGRAPLLRELGVDPFLVAGEVAVRYEPREGAPRSDLPHRIEARCP